jgi:hypothetical protein
MLRMKKSPVKSFIKTGACVGVLSLVLTVSGCVSDDVSKGVRPQNTSTSKPSTTPTSSTSTPTTSPSPSEEAITPAAPEPSSEAINPAEPVEVPEPENIPLETPEAPEPDYSNTGEDITLTVTQADRDSCKFLVEETALYDYTAINYAPDRSAEIKNINNRLQNRVSLATASMTNSALIEKLNNITSGLDVKIADLTADPTQLNEEIASAAAFELAVATSEIANACSEI